MSCSLLSELIIEILYRVPVKSLIRFKCVSKTWKSLVEDPDFVKSYMGQQKVKTKQLIVQQKVKTEQLIGQCNLKCRFLSVDLDSLDKSRIVNLPMIRRSYQRIDMIGSFNGLVTFCCTFSDLDDFIICNMTTGEHVIITLELPLPPKYAGLAYGFGYDGVGDDYKIVRTFYSFRGNGADLITMVYSLKKHEWVWSTINSPGYHFNDPPVGSLANGALHWLAYTDFSWAPIIVVFDLNTEDYHQVPLPMMADDPLPWMDGELELLELAVLGDSLCMVVFGDYRWGNVDIWSRKDCMIEQSWSKVYSLRLKSFAIPLAFSRSGDDTALLLLENKISETRVYWYNPSLKEEFQNLQTFFTPSSEFVTSMVYDESLTPIAGSNGTRGKPTIKKREREMSNGCI